MKLKASADYQRYQAELRKPKPVRRLSKDEIAALEHKRNLERYLTSGRRLGRFLA